MTDDPHVPPRLAEGSLFDRYRIEAELGAGGMGSVYRAFDTRLERRVALKILHPGVWDQLSGPASQGHARLLREARAAAALEHPNVVVVHDVGEFAGTPFVAMELVEGATLRAKIARGEGSLAVRLGWLRDVARALSAAHARGLVHRDIKPENVIVRPGGSVKVLDFGIARRTHGAAEVDAATLPAGVATLTGQGMVLGTPQYMAPEQLRDEPLDGRADQFAWGVLSYEVLSGHVPWAGRTGVSLVAQILSTEPPPLDLAELEPAVAAIVARAMHKRAADRYPTMDALLADLEPLAATAPVASVSRPNLVSPPPSVRDLGEAKTLPASLGAAATEASPGAARAPVPPRKGARLALLAGGAAVVALAAVVGVVGRRSPVVTEPPAPEKPAAREAGPGAHASLLGAPPPATDVPAAARAYREGLVAMHDDSLARAPERFGAAAAADPELGAAHLRHAVTLAWLPEPLRAREALQRARQARGTLSIRDRALLDALSPWIERGVDGEVASAAALDALAAAAPDDDEVLLYDAYLNQLLHRLAPARSACERVLASDPTNAMGWEIAIELLDVEGRAEERGRAIERCLLAAPQSIVCLQMRADDEVVDGRCDAAEATAREMVSRDPSAEQGYLSLATAGFGLGRPAGALQELLAQRAARVEPAARSSVADRDRLRLDAYVGDFASMERDYAAADERLAASPSGTEHAALLRFMLDGYAEEGKLAERGRLARSYLERQQSWLPISEEGGYDPTTRLLGAALQAGLMSRQARAAERGRWIAARHPTDGDAVSVWVTAYAAPAETPEDAREALAALASLTGDAAPPAAERMTPFRGAQVGKVLLLAGDAARALASLAPSGCDAFVNPVLDVRRRDWLGQAREASHDVPGACEAYRQVLSRWGSARPRSVTLEHARGRVAALRCPAP